MQQTEKGTVVSSHFTPEDRRFLLDLRRSLHRAPELSWQEHGTRERLRAALHACGVTDIVDVADTGLVARVPGSANGSANGSAKGGASGGSRVPTVAVRGDIDALPITELTGLPFASETPGVMHACGHDMHATWAVGAAMLLARQPAPGDVRIVLQPAEEVGEGAAKVLASGALDDVQAIFGAHVDWRFNVGEVVADSGPLAASTDTFSVTFTGRGGHGARPQDAIDPIVGLGSFVMEVQTIVSRRLDPALPGVITVGTIEAGNAANVIPETATCTGTVRATTISSRQLLLSELKTMAESIAVAHRLTAVVVFSEGTPPLVNSVRGAEWAKSSARALLGDAALRSLAVANMGGEDFSFYLERMEGCFMRVGTLRSGAESIGVHNPRFDPDEEALFVGTALLATCARTASAALANGG